MKEGNCIILYLMAFFNVIVDLEIVYHSMTVFVSFSINGNSYFGTKKISNNIKYEVKS